MPNKPKTITEMFEPNSNLGRLKQHIHQTKQLEQRLRKQLTPPLSGDYSWSIGNFRDRHLTIIVQNSGQASRLRFQQQIFLENAQSIQIDIESLSIKVRYQGKERKEPAKIQRKLSSKAAESIVASAEHISDSDLRAALQRLGQRGVIK